MLVNEVLNTPTLDAHKKGSVTQFAKTLLLLAQKKTSEKKKVIPNSNRR